MESVLFVRHNDYLLGTGDLLRSQKCVLEEGKTS